jgi:hypothetical protein
MSSRCGGGRRRSKGAAQAASTHQPGTQVAAAIYAERGLLAAYRAGAAELVDVLDRGLVEGHLLIAAQCGVFELG